MIYNSAWFRHSGRALIAATLVVSLFLQSVLPQSAAAVGEQTTVLNASADVYLHQGGPNTNEGASPILRVHASGDNRVLVAFDQSAIFGTIGGGVLVSAKLQLDIVKNSNSWGKEGRTIDVYRLGMAWAEGNGKNIGLPRKEQFKGTGAGATWNYAIDTDISNHRPDGLPENDWEMRLKRKGPNNPPWAESSTASLLITKNLTGTLEFDVTADVAAFLSGTPNYGWIIKKTEENRAGHLDFASRESESGGPRLVITYIPPEPSEQTLTAGKDSFIREGASNTNEGANPGLRIQGAGDNRVLVAFDLSGIDTSRVTRATLVLTAFENSGPGSTGPKFETSNWGSTGRTIDAHRLLTDWVEGNGKNSDIPGSETFRGTGAGVTYNCAIDADISNGSPDGTQWGGGDGQSKSNPDLYASPTAPSVLITNGYVGAVTFDVTADVRANATFGWLIRKTDERQSGQIHFQSREGTGPAPSLTIEFGP